MSVWVYVRYFGSVSLSQHHVANCQPATAAYKVPGMKVCIVSTGDTHYEHLMVLLQTFLQHNTNRDIQSMD